MDNISEHETFDEKDVAEDPLFERGPMGRSLIPTPTPKKKRRTNASVWMCTVHFLYFNILNAFEIKRKLDKT